MSMRTSAVTGSSSMAAPADVTSTVETKSAAPASASAAAVDVAAIAPKKPSGKTPRVVVYPPPTEQWMPPTTATVLEDDKAVHDGDTCKIPGFSIRLNGANAVERKPAEDGWESSQKSLEKLVKGKDVTLTYNGADPRDGYGRLVANISVGGKDVATEQIRKGEAHAYFVDADPTLNREALVAAQESAKKAGLGIWSQKRFKEQFSLTSFHPNGRGDDEGDPNVEYFRICNVASEPVDIGGWTVTSQHAGKFTLPSVVVPVGQTVQIFSGEGENTLNPPDEVKIYLGSKTPIWDNFSDKMELRNKKNHVVVSREQDQKMPNLEKFATAESVTQDQLHRLGADVKVTFSAPTKLPIKTFRKDDGDTIFMVTPPTGTFKATIADKYTLPLQISPNDQEAEGELGIRFFGMDAAETRVVKRLENGEVVFASQGVPGEAAKHALYEMLDNAKEIWVEPVQGQPFDYYGRLLGTVWMIPKGSDTPVNVNAKMVEIGMAEMSQYYKPGMDMKVFADLSARSKVAVDGKLGIYGDGEARLLERPADFRRRMANRPPARDFVADVTTKLVYPLAMADKVSPNNRMYILSNMLGLALKDPAMGFKLAAVPKPAVAPAPAGVASGTPGAETAEAPATADKPKARSRKPAAKAVRAHELQISEKSKKKKSA